jgi:hypothetical protein
MDASCLYWIADIYRKMVSYTKEYILLYNVSLAGLLARLYCSDPFNFQIKKYTDKNPLKTWFLIRFHGFLLCTANSSGYPISSKKGRYPSIIKSGSKYTLSHINSILSLILCRVYTP